MIKKTFSYMKGIFPEEIEKKYLSNLTLFVDNDTHSSYILAQNNFYGQGVYPVYALIDLFFVIMIYERIKADADFDKMNVKVVEKELDKIFNEEK